MEGLLWFLINVIVLCGIVGLGSFFVSIKYDRPRIYIEFYLDCKQKGITNPDNSKSQKLMADIAPKKVYLKNNKLSKAYIKGKTLLESGENIDELRVKQNKAESFLGKSLLFGFVLCLFLNLFQCSTGEDCSICGHSAYKSFKGRPYCSACYQDYKDVYYSYGGR